MRHDGRPHPPPLGSLGQGPGFPLPPHEDGGCVETSYIPPSRLTGSTRLHRCGPSAPDGPRLGWSWQSHCLTVGRHPQCEVLGQPGWPQHVGSSADTASWESCTGQGSRRVPHGPHGILYVQSDSQCPATKHWYCPAVKVPAARDAGHLVTCQPRPQPCSNMSQGGHCHGSGALEQACWPGPGRAPGDPAAPAGWPVRPRCSQRGVLCRPALHDSSRSRAPATPRNNSVRNWEVARGVRCGRPAQPEAEGPCGAWPLAWPCTTHSFPAGLWVASLESRPAEPLLIPRASSCPAPRGPGAS